jgi:hypothetical protein
LAEEFVERLGEKVRGKGKAPVRKERKTDSDEMLTELAIADSHIGVRIDGKECHTHNYDCDIAKRVLLQTADAFISRMGRPKQMVVSFSGDMSHCDNTRNVTEKSNNPLDVDSRFARVADYVVMITRDIVEMAAQIAGEVKVVVVPGNHSETSEIYLAKVLEAYYHNCLNVNVVIQRSPHKHLVWGENLLVWAHGHGVRLKQWGEVIPNEFREIWGTVKHCHVKTGHLHHRRGKQSTVLTQSEDGWVEHGGVLAEILHASVPGDSYHHFHGYGGQMIGFAGFEYHKKHGLYTRHYQPLIWD